MNIEQWIAERERIAEAATAGPWVYRQTPGSSSCETKAIRDVVGIAGKEISVGVQFVHASVTRESIGNGMERVTRGGEFCDPYTNDDCVFIADARTSLPAALKWMREAAACLESARKFSRCDGASCPDRCFYCITERLLSGIGGE